MGLIDRFSRTRHELGRKIRIQNYDVHQQAKDLISIGYNEVNDYLDQIQEKDSEIEAFNEEITKYLEKVNDCKKRRDDKEKQIKEKESELKFIRTDDYHSRHPKFSTFLFGLPRLVYEISGLNRVGHSLINSQYKGKKKEIRQLESEITEIENEMQNKAKELEAKRKARDDVKKSRNNIYKLIKSKYKEIGKKRIKTALYLDRNMDQFEMANKEGKLSDTYLEFIEEALKDLKKGADPLYFELRTGKFNRLLKKNIKKISKGKTIEEPQFVKQYALHDQENYNDEFEYEDDEYEDEFENDDEEPVYDDEFENDDKEPVYDDGELEHDDEEIGDNGSRVEPKGIHEIEIPEFLRDRMDKNKGNKRDKSEEDLYTIKDPNDREEIKIPPMKTSMGANNIEDYFVPAAELAIRDGKIYINDIMNTFGVSEDEAYRIKDMLLEKDIIVGMDRIDLLQDNHPIYNFVNISQEEFEARFSKEISEYEESQKNKIPPRDELFEEAGKAVIEKGRATEGMIQRIFKVGFKRAHLIIEQLEQAGVIEPNDDTESIFRKKVVMNAEEFETLISGQKTEELGQDEENIGETYNYSDSKEEGTNLENIVDRILKGEEVSEVKEDTGKEIAPEEEVPEEEVPEVEEEIPKVEEKALEVEEKAPEVEEEIPEVEEKVPEVVEEIPEVAESNQEDKAGKNKNDNKIVGKKELPNPKVVTKEMGILKKYKLDPKVVRTLADEISRKSESTVTSDELIALYGYRMMSKGINTKDAIDVISATNKNDKAFIQYYEIGAKALRINLNNKDSNAKMVKRYRTIEGKMKELEEMKKNSKASSGR